MNTFNMYPYSWIIIIIIIPLLSLTHRNDSSSIRIMSTQCNGKTAPLGVEQNNISFSWKMASSQRNQYQSAWRVVVATSKERLQNKTYIWDSGIRQGQKNTWIPYEGPSLEPAQRYYWKVKVWDKAGHVSAWSKAARFVTGIFGKKGWAGAQWIGFETLPDSLRLVPGVHGSGDDLGVVGKRRPVIPQFRKEFTIEKPVEEAFLFITGLGQYEASLNGKKIGNHFLSPGWTDYEETVLYNTFDVTDQVHQGENALGVIVGNGFYNVNRERYHKLVIAYGMPKMLSALKITYADGSTETIVSDTSWKASPSPITYTSIYGGEDYDARREEPEWNQPGFDDSDWKNALLVDAPAGQLRSQFSYPLVVQDTLEVQRILNPEPGIYIYDFGQNASGIMRLKVRGAQGQKVKLTPAELLDDKGLADQDASGGPHYYVYTLKGDGVEGWQPKFTYYGFRYIQVEGAAPDSAGQEDQPVLVDLDFLHTRSAAPTVGHFETSFDLFNDIYSLINWAIRSNLQSVVTDCPHREKLGWLEQTHLMGKSIHYNYHLYHLYKKLVFDMMDAQTPEGLVPSIAPEYVVFGGAFRDSPAWGSASVILPWLIYKWYGDARIMDKAWPMMTKYVDYLKSTSQNYIVSHGLGDWYDLGPKMPGPSQLTPKALTATAIYFYDVKLLSQMARMLDKPHEAKKYSRLAEQIYQAFNKKFYNETTDIYATGSQTAMAMPLVVGLVDSTNRRQVFRNLTDSIRANNKALTAGDVGFNYLVNALEQGGASQLLFEMNARSDVPGYGYQLKKGATALTESWAALERVSNNHLMLGHLMEWFYGGLAGIQQKKDSHGYNHILIEPHMVGDIEWTHAWYHSPNGKIRSAWSLSEGKGTMEVTIPVNATATVIIPSADAEQITESGKPVTDHPDILGWNTTRDKTRVKIGSGNYIFKFYH